ncbi:MAG: hypothetical protein IKO40_03495, partial [Kiritimatiellae bacterium]|nr:hypothetical protein [Kiritimatiellia bacterium]
MKNNIAFPKSVDTVAQKREQYRRVLIPPQERGFNPAAWLSLVDSPDVTQAYFSKLEDLFDARSRLYDAAERARRACTSEASVEETIAAGYAALNAMDLDGATAACEKLEAIDGVGNAEPPRANPFTWVKSFTQWGYMRHPEGTGVYEPDPWNLLWEDGFRFNLAQDARVSIANYSQSGGATHFFETRFSAPMDDVKTERTWIGTRWFMPDGKVVEFSILSPLVNVDGTDT